MCKFIGSFDKLLFSEHLYVFCTIWIQFKMLSAKHITTIILLRFYLAMDKAHTSCALSTFLYLAAFL